MKQYFELKEIIPEFNIKAPRFYNLDNDFNQMVELHILSLKKTGFLKNNPSSTDLGNKSTIPNTLTSEENTPVYKPLPKISDLSQIVPQLIPVGFSEKQLFCPPSKRAKPHQKGSQVNYAKKGNESDEEEKGDEIEKDIKAANNYLSVPGRKGQANYLNVPNESQIYFKNKANGDQTYNALNTYSPNLSQTPSLTDSYIAG